MAGVKIGGEMALVVKNLPANAGDMTVASSIPGSGRSPRRGMETHSSILAWRIPWTDEPGRLQSMGLQSRTWLKLLSMHKQGPLDPKAFWSKFLLYPDCRLYGSLSYHSLNATGTLHWILMVILLGKHHDFHFTNKQRRQVTSLRLGREKAGPYLPGAKGWCWAEWSKECTQWQEFLAVLTLEAL